MFHLDNNSGISSMPAPAAAQSNATRWFTEGAGTGVPSWPGQDWFNIVQAELLNVLIDAGIAPEKAKFNQLSLAIKTLVSSDAFLKVNLFSELKEAGASAQAIARANFGLKTAALADITTSNRDSTEGRVLRVGDYGLGKTLGKVTTGIDFKSYQFIQGERLFVPMSTCTNIPPGISATDYYFINVICLRDMDASPSLMMVKYLNPSEVWFLYGAGAAGSRAWSTSRVYTTGNKPSAIDVSAVESKGDVGSPGGTAWDNSWIGVTGGDGDIPNPGNDFLVITLAGKGKNSSGSYQLFFDGDTTTSNTGLRIYARGIDGGGTLNKAKAAELYHTGHKPTAADVGALSSGGGTLNGNLTVKNMIQVGGVGNGIINIGDNDSGLRSSVDGQVDLWSNNQKVGYWKSGTFSFTGQIVPTNYSNFDAKYQAKGNYTPAGQAYTKAESDARYIQNVQRGAATSPAKANEYGPNEAPTGCVLTRAWHDPGTSYGVFFTYRPLQIYINGGWKTIQG